MPLTHDAASLKAKLMTAAISSALDAGEVAGDPVKPDDRVTGSGAHPGERRSDAGRGAGDENRSLARACHEVTAAVTLTMLAPRCSPAGA
jgi:hypothetical protein